MALLSVRNLAILLIILIAACGDDDAATCTDGIEDGTETGVDCGGSCGPCAPPSNGVDAVCRPIDQCADAAEPPDCMPLPAGDASKDLVVDRCYRVAAGTYTYRYINVRDKGLLWFADEGGETNLRVSSLLVERGGRVKAGSWCRPLGCGGEGADRTRLTIGLWGDDPTKQATIAPGALPASSKGIACENGTCFPDASYTTTPHYCTQGGSDPCSSTTANGVGNNAVLEGYDALPFDDNPFGYKVLAVSYGGSLELFGRKGVAANGLADPTTPASMACEKPTDEADLKSWSQLTGSSWMRLAAETKVNARSLTLERTVPWEDGDKIVVASTDWNMSHTEVATLGPSTADGALSLKGMLRYPHAGTTYPVPPAQRAQSQNPNTEVDLRGAVGLLTRSIKIASLGATAEAALPTPDQCTAQNPECYFGGHVLARQGFGRFQIQGAELYQLGQGGRMGHYPVHFHTAKSTAYANAFVKDSAIWDSMTRFAVLHATHDVLLARNVGYLSVGHGFMLEDASEINNGLCHNLALSARPSVSEYFAAQEATAPERRVIPPILDAGQPNGSDSLAPVMFWTMNMWNRIVGNKAVGVGGFGSCYWLLGSGVSGHSAHLRWADDDKSSDQYYANFNRVKAQQAPVLSFVGNSCATSMYALQTTLEVTGGATFGYTALNNPYTVPSRPAVGGNYLPMRHTDSRVEPPNCGQVAPRALDGAAGTGVFDGNVKACVATVIDRFTTSFNWAPTGFGSVWLRPLWYVFTNSAITDQLGGGLGFVSGGTWAQVPPGYFTLTKNNVFIGSSRADDDSFGSRIGPRTLGTAPSQCSSGTCRLPADGAAFFEGELNPKRMITIYDGPFYADGNVFLRTPAFECDPTFADCGIYMSTVQPKGATKPMKVIDAAIGWKQTNGFYYPPVFAFRKSAFDASTTRHNVLDQYQSYVKVEPESPGSPMQSNSPLVASREPADYLVPVSPIDFSTILNDLDGTLTGVQSGASKRTSSLSRNKFFDAPAQDDECASFGVQTTPSEMATTVLGRATLPVGTKVGVLDNEVGPWGKGGLFPAVPIYRQLTLSTDVCSTPTVCDPASTKGRGWGCERASLMAGGQTGQSPYLTMDGMTYFLDTSPQPLGCVPLAGFHTPGFLPGNSYALYNLFAKDSMATTYQVYVGEDFDMATDGYWVRVKPHEGAVCGPEAVGKNCTAPADCSADPAATCYKEPGKASGVCRCTYSGNSSIVERDATYPGAPTFDNAAGVLTVTLDHRLIASEFGFKARAANEKCLPRDLCKINDAGDGCDVADRWTGTSLHDSIANICGDWVTWTAGRKPGSADDLSLSDCPSGGCLGYVFTLPATFVPKTYAERGMALARPFPQGNEPGASVWNRPMSLVDDKDMVCKAPRAPRY